MNRVTLKGNLVADPDVRQTKSGKKVATFSVATNSDWFDQDGVLQKSVDFHRVVAWEGLAKVSEKYLTKGAPVLLEGKLTNRSYEGKDKVRRFTTEVLLKDLHLLNKKPENEKEALAA